MFIENVFVAAWTRINSISFFDIIDNKFTAHTIRLTYPPNTKHQNTTCSAWKFALATLPPEFGKPLKQHSHSCCMHNTSCNTHTHENASPIALSSFVSTFVVVGVAHHRHSVRYSGRTESVVISTRTRTVERPAANVTRACSYSFVRHVCVANAFARRSEIQMYNDGTYVLRSQAMLFRVSCRRPKRSPQPE